MLFLLYCFIKMYDFTQDEKDKYPFLKIKQFQNLINTGLDNLLDDSIYQFLDLMPACVYWKNLNGIYLGANKAMLDLVGLKNKNELIGQSDEILVDPSKLKEVQDFDQNIMKSGIPHKIEEIPLLKHNSKLRIFFSSKIPLRDTDNKVVGLFGVSIDITDLKEAQEKELLAQKISNDQMQFRQAVVQYSGTLSHDLKNPLHALGLHLEMIGFKIGEEDRKKIADHLAKMKENIDRMVQTIDLSNKMIREVASENPKLLVQKKRIAQFAFGQYQ